MRGYYCVKISYLNNGMKDVIIEKLYGERLPEDTLYKSSGTLIKTKYFFSKDLAEFYASTLTI